MDNQTKNQSDHNRPSSPSTPTPPSDPSQGPKPRRKPQSKGDPLRRPAVNPPSQSLNRRRSSKIAHFPKSLRDQINQMLHDGLTYAEITKKVGKEAKRLNKDNLSRWYASGYQEWINDRLWLDHL